MGRQDRKLVRIGKAHQCTAIPDCEAELEPRRDYLPAQYREIPEPRFVGVALKSKEVEAEVAAAVCRRLTRAAYDRRRPPAPRSLDGANDADDMVVMQPLLDAGLLIGAGRSSYVPGRGMLAAGMMGRPGGPSGADRAAVATAAASRVGSASSAGGSNPHLASLVAYLVAA